MGVVAEINRLSIPNSDLWISEAEFGFRHVKQYCQSCPEGGDVLEVGCGSGILLSMLAERFERLNFSGIEPFGDGFASLAQLNTFVQESGVTIANCGYENFSADQAYDLIYCVNVFEHVDDWRHMLGWVSKMLKEGGKFVVLCPNYSFPYESHFRIPIFLNKSLTHSVFRKSISKLEEDTDTAGLWNSLNFVKKRDVERYIRRNDDLSLALRDDTTIIDDMVDRVSEDEEFRKRQKIIGSIAIGAKKLGLFEVIKLFRQRLPYMKLEFTRVAHKTD